MYANSLVEVGKLIYLVGSFSETATLKKILESSDGKSKIFYRCVEELPPNTLRKVKPNVGREGIVRADWLFKIIDRYPEMVIFLFNLGDDTLDLQKIEAYLRDILKKINLFVMDTLKANMKEDVIMRIIVTITRQQFDNQLVKDKIGYYLKTYEKDLFIVQTDTFTKEISKYRGTWLGYLEKNYERKFRKLLKKTEEALSIDKRICYSFKAAIFSQILGKDEKLYYNNLYNVIRYKFADITKKDFSFVKFLEIKELRNLADTTFLRQLKHRIISTVKQLPQQIGLHLSCFKMRSIEPNSCHFHFYFEELQWRSTFIDNLLEVLYATDVIELLPHVTLAEYVNGLLSYLHRLATVDPDILNGIEGKQIQLGDDIYLGKLNYSEVSDSDIIVTSTQRMIRHRKDYISKGIQVITRYKTSGLFRENQINFLNIYLIRFYLADGKFAAIITIYNQILRVEVNRCNYFLINQMFRQIKNEMDNIDSDSKVLLYGVASLICDYFESWTELNNYLRKFFSLIGEADGHLQQSPQKEGDLFVNELAPEAHVFKLKKSSAIFSVQVLINDQIILSEGQYRIRITFTINQCIRERLKKGSNKLQLHFNQQAHGTQRKMVSQVSIVVDEDDGEKIVRQIVIEPLTYIRRDAVLKIEEIHLVMEKKKLVWVLQRNQIVFERYDSSLFFCKMEEPEILIQDLRKNYYINETACFSIVVKGLQGCKVSTKLSVVEEAKEKTEFFINLREKKDITNSQLKQDLIVSSNGADRNICWIKLNKTGNKTLKLQFESFVQKSIQVSWREKPLNLKAKYNSVKEITFNVAQLFTVNKVFRQALTGNLFNNNIPINKKTLLCFYIKSNEQVLIRQLAHHNNPRKIKYLKSARLTDVKLSPTDSLKINLLFEINEDCQNEFELFLTTLYIKWSRIDTILPIDNTFLDEETKINAANDKAQITFEQKTEIFRRRKSTLWVKVQNLTPNPIRVYSCMQSTENLMRIGEKSKGKSLGAFERCELGFDILCIHSGIFDFPPVKVWIDEAESKVSTNNFLIYCT